MGECNLLVAEAGWILPHLGLTWPVLEEEEKEDTWEQDQLECSPGQGLSPFFSLFISIANHINE